MILIFHKGLDQRHVHSSVWTINTYTLVSGLQTHTFHCLNYRHVHYSVWTIDTFILVSGLQTRTFQCLDYRHIHSSVWTIDTYTLVSGLQTHTFQCLDFRRVHSSVAKIQELECKAHREQNNAKFIFIMATFPAIYIANQCAKMSILRAKPQSAKECSYAHR